MATTQAEEGPRRPPLPARTSIFREETMPEYTPANSILEEETEERNTCARVLFRLVNTVAHSAICVLLLVIMVQFLVWYKGTKRRPQAIALTVLTSLDTCLDINAVIFLKSQSKSWPGWAVLLRLIMGLGYIAMFLVYIGVRDVFPSQYIFWGMKLGFAESLVYIFLWLIGLWNLLHTAIYRHSLGKDVRRYLTATTDSHNQQPASRSQTNATRSRRSSPRTLTDVEEGRHRDGNDDVTLVEVRMEDKGCDMGPSRSTSSMRSNEILEITEMTSDSTPNGKETGV